uniref:UBC core domain-containing protein n=1 Tax=Aegilops tauschii subsp. strangulata TaxID=200361 RepID=A0A453PFL5_AEGTS
MPESGRAMRRIRKELELLWTDPPAFCRPGLAPVTDLFHWEVVIDGPDGSPYAGGTFPVDVAYPKDYPFDPIKLTFRTKVSRPALASSCMHASSIKDRPTRVRAKRSMGQLLSHNILTHAYVSALHCRCTIRTSARRGRWRWTSSGASGGLL